MKITGARTLNHVLRLPLLSTWQITNLWHCCDVDDDDDGDDDGWLLEQRRCGGGKEIVVEAVGPGFA